MVDVIDYLAGPGTAPPESPGSPGSPGGQPGSGPSHPELRKGDKGGDVVRLQQLLNAILQPDPLLVIDGDFGNNTLAAVIQFQLQAGIQPPNGIVGKSTWDALLNPQKKPGLKPIAPKPPATGVDFTVTVKHGGVRPRMTNPHEPNGVLYESTITLSGQGAHATCVGSIYPDDMIRFGRVADGTYPLTLGWHSRDGNPTPTQNDLCSRGGGFRCALLINGDDWVPIISEGTDKASQNLHLHTGGSNKRLSSGCITFFRSWTKFITPIIDRYPNVKDWGDASTKYVGVRVGQLIVTK